MNNKGNSSIIIAVVGIVVVGIVGYFMYSSTRPESSSTQKTKMMEETTSADSMEGTDTMMENTSMNGYSGELLAGTVSPYYAFNQADFEKAQAEGKVIVLDFYATWCPVCRAEAPDLQAGFDELNNENVVGFRVNYNDPETDEAEKALAQEHGVTYQHTKVIIKDGEQVLKDGLVWDKEEFLKQVNSVL